MYVDRKHDVALYIILEPMGHYLLKTPGAVIRTYFYSTVVGWTCYNSGIQIINGPHVPFKRLRSPTYHHCAGHE